MPPAGSRGRRRLGLGLAALLLLIVVLVVLALPFRGVPGDADAAQAELVQAADALGSGDADAATAHVEAARRMVDDVRSTTEGVGGHVWSLVPVAGGGVRDVRRLADALDDLTAAAEVAVRDYPEVAGPDATLFQGEGVDLATLGRLATAVGEIEDHVRSARASLDAVSGDAPLVGSRTAEARALALERLAPVEDGVEAISPLLDALPDVLGADGERRYVVAILNPAEMRYSGGATLTFATASVEDGLLTLGATTDTDNDARAFRPKLWEGVEGNPFHSPFRQRISNANIAPSWPVSGEELLRAWSKVQGEDADGLVAIDVVALARLLDVTGPLRVPGYDRVDSANLVELTVGSYDRFDASETARRKALNRALVPAFTSTLFGGVDAPGAVRALAESARARHLAIYLRDPAEQAVVAEAGVDGDLADTDGDYLGVFSQNLGGTKSDYWQHKLIDSDVRLAADGSARVTLDVTVRNEAVDDGTGADAGNYTRLGLDLSLAPFLPRGAQVRAVRWRGEDVDPDVGDYYGRPYLTLPGQIPPGGSLALRLTYDVPRAATVSGDELVYRLDVDNHPTVRPEQLRVTVHWPDGWAAGPLPKDWTLTGSGAARLGIPVLDGSHAWRVAADRTGATP